jgi:membrane protein required for colicin V production
MNAFNWVDFALVGIVALSALMSLLRGFVREALALAGWVAAVWIAFTFTPDAAVLLTEHVSVPSVRMGIAFVVLFVATLMVSGLVVYLVGLLVDKTGLSGTDRMFGMVFGVARGFIIAAILVMLAGLTPMPRDPWWRASVLLPHFQRVAEQLRTLLPDEVRQYVDFSPTPASAPQTPPARTPVEESPAVLNPPDKG